MRTQSILARHLPPAPAVIYDIGGAAGVHAFWLAERRYGVRLIDPVERHLAEARVRQSQFPLDSIAQGDARKLDVPSHCADAVLLLGPLYHLQDRNHRLDALKEARRILRPSGVLFAAGISRFASLADGVARGTFSDPLFREIVAADLRTGEHRNVSTEISYFTTAYFHRPEELAGEVAAAGFHSVESFAVEGPVWMGARFREVWADEEQRLRLLEFLEQIECEPSVLGASAHLLVHARA